MLIIGNGESRKGIKLDNISCEKIGCNAIFREAKVRHIVCCDRRMVKEAVSKYINQKSGIWTRSDWREEFGGKHNINTVPGLWYSTEAKKDQPFHWGSGPYAVYIGCTISKPEEVIDLLGFDLYSNSETVNNIYKGTPNYEGADSHAIDPSFWIHQISKIFERYSNRKFRIFNQEDWTIPDSWKKENVSFFNLTQFKEMLNYKDV